MAGMNKYKVDANRIKILCDIYGPTFEEGIVTCGMKSAYFRTYTVIEACNVEFWDHNEVLDIHLPILILHNQNCSNIDDIDREKPYLEFIVGTVIKE